MFLDLMKHSSNYIFIISVLERIFFMCTKSKILQFTTYKTKIDMFR